MSRSNPQPRGFLLTESASCSPADFNAQIKSFLATKQITFDKVRSLLSHSYIDGLGKLSEWRSDIQFHLFCSFFPKVISFLCCFSFLCEWLRWGLRGVWRWENRNSTWQIPSLDETAMQRLLRGLPIQHPPWVGCPDLCPQQCLSSEAAAMSAFSLRKMSLSLTELIRLAPLRL